jgi:sensor domain CHASE-containing protein
MRIRRKVLLANILVFALLLTVLTILDAALLGSFSRLEDENSRHSVGIAVNSLSDAISDLNRTNADWSYWDDTYSYANGTNEGYVDVNLGDEVFTTLKLNVIIVFNASGDVFFAKQYDLEENAEEPLDPEIAAKLGPDIIGRTGMIPTNRDFVLVSQLPIMKSDRSGPPTGKLVMGEYVNRAYIDGLSKRMGLDIDVIKPSDISLKEDRNAFAQSSAQDGTVVIKVLADDTIAGYAALKGIDGEPAALLKVTVIRTIYPQGRDTITNMWLASFILGAALITLSMVLMDRIIIADLEALNRQVDTVGEKPDRKNRLIVQGDDEMAGLARGINKMLESLESTINLKDRNIKLEEEVAERTRMLEEKLKEAEEVRSSMLSVLEDSEENRGRLEKTMIELARNESELKTKITQLERFQKVTVDRELKMVELKKRIKALEREAGRPQEGDEAKK